MEFPRKSARPGGPDGSARSARTAGTGAGEPIALPRPLPPEFVADCPYGPGGLLLDLLLCVDPERSLVRARMPTHDELPLTREQRAHPVRHPRHVSGGLMVHMTGMIGFVHAYYVLGLRHADGWIGYGGRIHSARFRSMAIPGEPMELECVAKQMRRGARRVLARYDLRFEQRGKLIYEGDQTAMWLKVDESNAAELTGAEDLNSDR